MPCVEHFAKFGWILMSTLETGLTDDERKLLTAAVVHARSNLSASHLEVHRIVYGFKTNLAEYGESITDPAEKARWETALKSLVTQGLLRHVAAGNQSWTYAVADQGLRQSPDISKKLRTRG